MPDSDRKIECEMKPGTNEKKQILSYNGIRKAVMPLTQIQSQKIM